MNMFETLKAKFNSLIYLSFPLSFIAFCFSTFLLIKNFSSQNFSYKNLSEYSSSEEKEFSEVFDKIEPVSEEKKIEKLEEKPLLPSDNKISLKSTEPKNKLNIETKIIEKNISKPIIKNVSSYYFIQFGSYLNENLANFDLKKYLKKYPILTLKIKKNNKSYILYNDKHFNSKQDIVNFISSKKIQIPYVIKYEK